MRTILVGISSLCLSVAAQAQMGPPDIYGDATVTRSEAEAIIHARFAELDTDHDGSLTMQERMAQMRGMAGGPGGGRGPGPGMAGPGGGQGGPGGPGMMGPVDDDSFLAMQLGRFDRMDANSDGTLTKEERDSFRPPMMMGGGSR